MRTPIITSAKLLYTIFGWYWWLLGIFKEKKLILIARTYLGNNTVYNTPATCMVRFMCICGNCYIKVRVDQYMKHTRVHSITSGPSN